jgi:hypothetical protein
MRIALAAFVAICAGASLHASQEPKKNNKPVIVVNGCVDGSWLIVRQTDPSGTTVERYKLRGAKALMKEIEKQYRGHLLEVTGAVTDMGNTTHKGKTIEVGKKTRITTGAKEVPVQPTGANDPLLEVDSFRDLKDTCK